MKTIHRISYETKRNKKPTGKQLNLIRRFFTVRMIPLTKPIKSCLRVQTSCLPSRNASKTSFADVARAPAGHCVLPILHARPKSITIAQPLYKIKLRKSRSRCNQPARCMSVNARNKSATCALVSLSVFCTRHPTGDDNIVAKPPTCMECSTRGRQ